MDLNKTNVSDLAAKLGTTSEVITKYLAGEDAPEAKTFKESLPTLEVFTSEEFTRRIENEKQQALQGQEGKIKGSVLGDVDKTVKADTGLERADNESTQEYIKRAYGEKLKSSGGKTNEQLDALRQQLADKDNALQNALTAAEEQKAEYEAQRVATLAEMDQNQAIAGLKIKAETPERLQQQQGFLKYSFNQQYEIKSLDGKPVVYDRSTGQPVKDARTADYKTPAAVMAEIAPKYVTLAEDTPAPKGSGFLNKPLTGNGQAADKNDVDFSQYDSVEQFKEHLQKSGISLISEQGNGMLEGYLQHQQKAATADAQ